MDFDFPWQQLTGEPIVYASMGTLQKWIDRHFSLDHASCDWE